MKCQECGHQISEMEDYYNVDNEIYCSSCADENFKKYYFYCTKCSQDFFNFDHFYFVNKEIYCAECFWNDYGFTYDPEADEADLIIKEV